MTVGPTRPAARAGSPGAVPGVREGERLIPIGQVDRPRGLEGEVVVTVFADDPDRMGRIGLVYLSLPGGYQKVAVEGYKRLGERAVIRLEGCSTPDQARGLVGRELFIPASASTPAPEGRYYAYQLLGLEVRLPDGTALGTVGEVLRQGPQSLLVVRTSSGDVLVPLARSICVAIDLERGTVTLDPPAGLIELNRPADAGG